MNIKKMGNRALTLLLVLCMIFTICYGAVEHISRTALVTALSSINDKAIKLKYGENISNITMSYLDGDNWIDITDANNSDLPANANYQIEFSYNNISINDLVEADYQLVYDQLPDWLVMTESGVILYDNEIAANIEMIDGKIVITFDKDWLEQHSSSGTLNGSFNLFGTVDWHKIPGNREECKFPGLELTFDFERDLAQKYGKVDIEKSEPNLIAGDDGNYYLEYEITVSSLETAAIPDITVKDLFSNISYISGYVGIDMNDPAEYLPIIDNAAVSDIPAVLYKDGDTMLWRIGELGPGEVRTLKYYALISESYIDSVISNPIQNRARVYSGSDSKNYQKDDDASSFTPNNIIELQKSASEPLIEPNGNGTITYTVTITAPEDNSFDYTGLTFKDSFPEELSYYLSCNNGNDFTVTVDGKDRTVTYTDGSFELSDINLKKGDTITITYTVRVENIFLYNNGEVALTNVASINKGSRTLKSTSDTETLEKANSVRKIYGSETHEELTVHISDGDVYEYTEGSVVRGTDPGSFTVPKGSHKYDVVLNESGNWDMSSTAMKDSFGGNENIAYTGYVQIRLYGYSNENAAALSDNALVSELERSAAVKTVWLKVDGLNEFSFTPAQLGVDNNTNYTYLLTYYAEPKNIENVGKLDITNDFVLSGNIGYGDGKYFPFPGIHVSTGKIITGGANYEAGKIGWYYELPGNVYQTEAVTSGAYPLGSYPLVSGDDFTTQYKNGAVYWVIRLEGNIKAGSATEGSYGNNNPVLSDFYIKDKPANSTINRDAVVGVFKGSKDFDFTQYDSYADFMEEKFPNVGYGSSADGTLTRLKGNSRNDSWFNSAPTKFDDPDYEWFASNSDLNGLIFKKAYNLKESNEAIFIVFRTASNTNYSSNNEATATWTNTLSITDDKTSFDVNTAQVTYQFKGSLYKESKGAYIFDKNAGTFKNISNQNTKDAWNPSTLVGASNLDSSGVYAVWLLNVNWDGSMEGEAYINDYLPEGMELEYVEVNNFGNSIRSEWHNWPTTGYIEELQNDPDWWELSRDQILTANGDRVRNQPITTISYYNPETREIRWHISGLTKNDQYKQYEINFRIVCRVVDPELFLSCTGKNYENYASIWDTETQSDIEMETADVTIYWNIDKTLDEAALRAIAGTVINGNSINGVLNKLPFKLEINPFGENMSGGNMLPALIDELDLPLVLIEDSIKVTAGGEVYTAFTYTVDEDDNGRQTLIINNLPDNTPLTITYDARVSTLPSEPVNISNTAYWAGNEPPDKPQVKDKEFRYQPSGDVFVNNPIKIKVIKVDSSSHSKRLQGAEFEIFEADGNGDQVGDVLATATTASDGTVIFENGETGNATFKFNTIYCIREKTAPNGYKTDENNCHYFVIAETKSDGTVAEVPPHSKSLDLDIWYDSPEYSCAIENDKGTISVEKVFQREDGEEYKPESGSYNFGLFDANGNLLETLTIEYTENSVNYYLDNVPKSSPDFTKFEPTGRLYYIYELDESGDPIKNGDTFNKGDITYKVTYGTDGRNEVYSNSSIKINNRGVLSLPLPSAGGIGLKIYYLTGALLILMALTFAAVQYVLKKRKGT